MALHINIEDLLSAKTVESDRIEFKEDWNPDAIYRSICAFANDFDNIGGGYILVGVAEDEVTRTAKRPVKGLTTREIAQIQQKMIGFNDPFQQVQPPQYFIENKYENQLIANDPDKVRDTVRDTVGDIAGAIASIQASAIAEKLDTIDNLAVRIVDIYGPNEISAVAGAVASAIATKEIKVLQTAKQPTDRQSILKGLGVTNHRKNYERFMLAFIELNWLSMTIPNKPTSPKQKYLTTLKGRVVLEILKRNKK